MPASRLTLGWIYFVHAKEMGRTKIGFTGNRVQGRLDTLQTGSPCKLSLRGVVPGTPAREGLIHAMFSEYRAIGEWFDDSDELDLLADVLSYAREPWGLPRVDDWARNTSNNQDIAQLREQVEYMDVFAGRSQCMTHLWRDVIEPEARALTSFYAERLPRGCAAYVSSVLFSQMPVCACCSKRIATEGVATCIAS